jgi:hypothetical protein
VSGFRSWLRALGAVGVLGIGILFFCLAYYLSALRPAEHALEAGLAAASGDHARRPVATGAAGSELNRFYSQFPPLERSTDELERVLALARDSGLELRLGEYRLERRAGVSSYRVTLPVRGSYAQVRTLASAILSGMPAASIDGLRFERRKSADPQLEARLELTLYLRTSGDLP